MAAAEDNSTSYERLPEDPYFVIGAKQASNSLAWRLAVVGSAIIGCFFTAGLVFGYSAIAPQLFAHGAFHDKCHGAGVLAPKSCTAQSQALTGMFTLATSALNLAGVLVGAILDRVGPRGTAAGAALLVALGALLFSLGGPGPWERAYTGGFLVMGVAGPAVFVSSLSLANLFPSREGLCTAAFLGCFDASSAIFIGLAWLMASGVSFGQAFAGYALIPLFISMVVGAIWPRVPVQKIVRKQMDSRDSLESGVDFPLAKLSVWQQAMTVEFLLLLLSVSAGMVCINFFIATCDLQMSDVDKESAPMLGQVFSAMLPLGGIVYIPVVGAIVDHLGPTNGWLVLWLCLLAFALLNAAYGALGVEAAAYGSFVIFTLCRPLFYVLGASFTGQFFGFETFGTLYGVLYTLAGVANLAVQPLHILADTFGFPVANAVLLAVHIITVALPLTVKCKDHRKGTRRGQRRPSEEFAGVLARSRSLSGG